MFARPLSRLTTAASILVLPLALLLFLQWPLREWVRTGSREANDLAQIFFALYMAVAVTAASRAGTHLSAHSALPPGAASARSRYRNILMAVCVLPWSGYLLWNATPLVWRSLRILESFPESLIPGYFLIKVALWLLACLVLLDAADNAWSSLGKGHR